MLVKGVIRPDLREWNREKFSKADLEREVKLRTTSNLGIPLLPVHKMCRTEKNKIHDIMHRDPPKAIESQYRDIQVMLPLLKNPESPRHPETLERSTDKFGLGNSFKQTSPLFSRSGLKTLNTSAQLTSVSIRSQSPRPFLSPSQKLRMVLDPEFEVDPRVVNLNLRDVNGLPAKSRRRHSVSLLENPNSLTTTKFAMHATSKRKVRRVDMTLTEKLTKE